jgi:flagellar hook-associated protein 1 FlgK
MLSLFGALDMASRSMQAQMTGVNVAGQNLANVNTTGYTRQTVDIKTSLDLTTTIGPEGTGATVVAIQQAVNQLLNSQIQNQQSSGGYWTAQQSALQSLQTSLNEFLNSTGATSSAAGNTTTDTGLSGQLSGLFNAFQAVATSPTSIPARQALVSAAQTLANMFNQVNGQLNTTRSSLNTSLTQNVSDANTLLSGIATLNKQISAAQFSGGTPNDLLDEREQDLEKLSKLANIQISTGTSGAVDVSIGGQMLVSDNQVTDTLQTYDASGSGQWLVQTAAGGTHLTLTGGAIQGTIDARDGELATMQSNLNTLASTLITQVNTIHGNGYSLTGTNGVNFFNGADASNIAVNAALVNNPSLVQASNSAAANGDNSIALQLADLATTTQTGLNSETFGEAYASTVATFGTALQTANTQVNNQTAVGNMLATQRSSTSGVNIDEEMTNLMSFQRAYEASAQVVSTINQMMETVNNLKN